MPWFSSAHAARLLSAAHTLGVICYQFAGEYANATKKFDLRAVSAPPPPGWFRNLWYQTGRITHLHLTRLLQYASRVYHWQFHFPLAG
jgi:hypothetical protein